MRSPPARACWPTANEPGQHPHRRDELHQVGREGEERARGVMWPLIASQPPSASTRHLGERRDRLQRRACSGPAAARAGCGRAKSRPAAVGQAAELAVLLAEALDDPDAADGLVDDAGHLAGALLGVPAWPGTPSPRSRSDDDQQQRERRRAATSVSGGDRTSITTSDDDQHHDVAEHDRQEREQALDAGRGRRTRGTRAGRSAAGRGRRSRGAAAARRSAVRRSYCTSRLTRPPDPPPHVRRARTRTPPPPRAGPARAANEPSCAPRCRRR